jgi:hypothetical protein
VSVLGTERARGREAGDRVREQWQRLWGPEVNLALLWVRWAALEAAEQKRGMIWHILTESPHHEEQAGWGGCWGFYCRASEGLWWLGPQGLSLLVWECWGLDQSLLCFNPQCLHRDRPFPSSSQRRWISEWTKLSNRKPALWFFSSGSALFSGFPNWMSPGLHSEDSVGVCTGAKTIKVWWWNCLLNYPRRYETCFKN